jgi:hypothetical protein
MPSSHLILVAALVGCIVFPFNTFGDTGPAGTLGGGTVEPGPRTVPTAPFSTEGDIEDIDMARYRLATDFASCLRTHELMRSRSILTHDEHQIVDACMVQRGWISVDPPGQKPGATSCRAINSGNGVYVTFCP